MNIGAELGAMPANVFDNDRAMTESFVKLLTDLDLLTSQQANFTPRLPDGSAGEPQLAGFLAGEPAEAHPLHPAGDPQAHGAPGLFRRSAHGSLPSFQPWRPRRGTKATSSPSPRTT